VYGVYVCFPFFATVAEWVFVWRVFVQSCSSGVEFPHAPCMSKAEMG
jgi:hypothetical protein